MSEKPGTGFVTVKNFQGALEELNTYRKRCDVMKKALQRVKYLLEKGFKIEYEVELNDLLEECDEALKIL